MWDYAAAADALPCRVAAKQSTDAKIGGRTLRDGDFGNVLDCPPARYAGIVVIETPAHGSRALVLNLLAAFVNTIASYEPLTGKLIIVEPGRVRVRTG